MTYANSFWSMSIGDVITLIAALVAIIALWSEITSVKKQLFIQNFSDYTKRYQEIIQQFPENINESSFDLETLSPEEYAKTMRAMRQYFDLCSEEYFLFQNGKLDNIIWKIWREGMLFAVSKRAFISAWEKIQKDTQYSTEFKDLLNAGKR